ncbi:MAG: SEC-C metal-binding domain-containing protein, partial [Lentisphaeria bacterium]
GLHVIGSERHDSRRIDRQLRGRCSRQGDPGSTSFYVSLEDDLMRLFGSERVASIMERLGMKEGEELCSPILSRSIGGAQKRVEQQHYSMRKRILQYDDVMNKQREVIYGFRTDVLKSEDTRKTLFDVIERSIDDSFDKFVPENPRMGSIDKDAYLKWLRSTIPVVFPDEIMGEGKAFDREKVLSNIVSVIEKAYQVKEQSEDVERLRWIEREIILNAIDSSYKKHLYEMDQLRNSIHLRSYAQKDPLVEFKTEAYYQFVSLMDEISQEILSNVFRTATSIEAMREFLMSVSTEAIHEETMPFDQPSQEPEMQLAENTTFYREAPKVGRNDLCPCGSGKKYKQCCGRES